MAHYAKVKNGIVETVIVAEAEFLKLLLMILQVNGFKHLIIHEEAYTMILQLESLAKIKARLFEKITQLRAETIIARRMHFIIPSPKQTGH